MNVTMTVEGLRHGEEYREEHPVNVHWNLARGRYELLSDLVIRETLKDLLAELDRREAIGPDLRARACLSTEERPAVVAGSDHCVGVRKGFASAPGGRKKNIRSLDYYDNRHDASSLGVDTGRYLQAR